MPEQATNGGPVRGRAPFRPDVIEGGGRPQAIEVANDVRELVIIKSVDTASSGEIVVALVEGEEATLKRLRKKGQSIALEPANRAYETRIFGPDQVEVQGKLVGLIRRYH